MSMLYPVEFWCVGCETQFEAEVNEDDLEQAECPNCGKSCISFELELEDAERQALQNKTMQLGCASLFFGFGRPVKGMLESDTGNDLPLILEQPSIHHGFRIVCRETSEENCIRLMDHLFEFGIICELSEPITNSNGEAIYEVFVPRGDAERARKLAENFNE